MKRGGLSLVPEGRSGTRPGGRRAGGSSVGGVWWRCPIVGCQHVNAILCATESDKDERKRAWGGDAKDGKAADAGDAAEKKARKTKKNRKQIDVVAVQDTDDE